MSKILLTGADGFIGSHLAEVLIISYEVRAFCFYNSTVAGDGWLRIVLKII